MFSYKCSPDSYSRICSIKGICAKDPACMAVEEFLFQGLKAISIYVKKISDYGGSLEGFLDIAIKVLNTSLYSISSDNDKIMSLLKEIDIRRDEFKTRYNDIMRARGFQIEMLDQSLYWQPKYKIIEIIKSGEQLSQKKCRDNTPEVNAMVDLLLHSIKGMIQHVLKAKDLGQESIEVTRFLYESIYSLTQELNIEKLQKLIEKSADINAICFKLVSDGLLHRYGEEDITKIRISPIEGKSILVSGRDFKDLEDILKATVSKGINVYTHGEMIMAHVFPELRAFPNLVGNYGGFGGNQQEEVESFPGAVLITSNCVWDPPEVYRGRVFTTGLPGWLGITQISNQDYGPLIKSALDAEGFVGEHPGKFVKVGFNYDKLNESVLKITQGLEEGSIKHVFLIIGCSSLSSQMEYISEFVGLVPDNCAVIHFTGLSSEQSHKVIDVKGVPKIFEFGVFDDLLSVIKILSSSDNQLQSIMGSEKLSTVFFLRDQSAMAVLISILKFKKSNIKIGTCAPFLFSPMTFKALDNAFGVKKVSTPESDLKDFLDL